VSLKRVPACEEIRTQLKEIFKRLVSVKIFPRLELSVGALISWTTPRGFESHKCFFLLLLPPQLHRAIVVVDHIFPSTQISRPSAASTATLLEA
jgi:hypothetical protein